jgi:hypothetical protein
LRDGARYAVIAAVEDAVRPVLAPRILGIRAQNIATGFEDAERHRFPILRQKEDRAAAGVDLGDEFREAARVGEIDARSGFACVPVAAGDQRP